VTEDPSTGGNEAATATEGTQQNSRSLKLKWWQPRRPPPIAKPTWQHSWSDENKARAEMLFDDIEREQSGHRTPDALLYNGGTGLALALTSAATVVAPTIWARSLSAVATGVIAISRALDFGGRWRWHCQRELACQALLVKLRHLHERDGKTVSQQLDDIEAELLKLLESGATLPGVGSPSTAG
jgi:hypothetical protein